MIRQSNGIRAAAETYAEAPAPLPPPTLTGNYAAWFLADCAERAYEDEDHLRTCFAGSKAPWTFRAAIQDEFSEAFAYIVTSDASKEIVVSIRGSVGLLDMAWNLKEIQKIAPWWPVWGDDLGVVEGWVQMWGSIAERVWQALRLLIEGFGMQARLYFTGHSRGGALATLATVEMYYTLLHHFPEIPHWDVSLYTVAAPPVGNQPFAEQFKANLLPRLRACRHFLNAGDMITNLITGFMTNISPKVALRAPYAVSPSSNSEADALRAYASHSVTDYVDLLASAEDPPPCPLWPDELAKRLVVRIYTGNWPTTPPASVTLTVGTDAQGNFGVPLLIVNPLLDGHYQYFQENTTLTLELPLPPDRPITVAEFAHCSITVNESSLNPEAPGWHFGGIQLIVNGATLYTRWTINATLNDVNDECVLDIPVPYPRIVGGRLRATNANHYGDEWIDMYAWGRQTDNEQTFALGYCYTPKWRDCSYGKASFFFTEPSLARPLVLSGFNETTNSDGKGPWQPHLPWGPADHAGTTQVVLNEGYCCGSGKNEKYQKTWAFVTEATTPANPGNPIVGGCIRLSNSGSPLDEASESVVAGLCDLSPAGIAEIERLGIGRALGQGGSDDSCEWRWGMKTEYEALINEWWAYLPVVGKHRTRVFFYFAKSPLPMAADASPTALGHLRAGQTPMAGERVVP